MPDKKEASVNMEGNIGLVYKFEILKTLLDITEKESDRFWQRARLLITINSALMALAISLVSISDMYVVIILSLFGIMSSLAWIQILRTGKYYASRWRADAKYLIDGDPVLANYFHAAAKKPRIKRPFGPKSSMCIMIMAYVSILFWISIPVIKYIWPGKYSINNPSEVIAIPGEKGIER